MGRGKANLIFFEGRIKRIAPSASGRAAWLGVQQCIGTKNEDGTWDNEWVAPRDFLVPSWEWENPDRRKLYVMGMDVTIHGEFRSYVKSGETKATTYHKILKIFFMSPLDEDKDMTRMREKKTDFIKKIKGDRDAQHDRLEEKKGEETKEG